MTGPLARIRRHAGARFHFVRHLVEMFLAMMIGMPVGRLFFAAVYGSGSNETLRQHPVASVLVMAFSMTVPMVAWMLFRGHSWRSAAEMAAVMIAPALPFVALKLAHAVTGPVSGPYMWVSTVGMIVLMVCRRREYRAVAAHA